MPKTKDSAERLGSGVENSHGARNVSHISHRSGCTICVLTNKCLNGCLDMLTSPDGLARTTRPARCASRSFCAVSGSCCDTFAGAVHMCRTDRPSGLTSLGRDTTAQCSAPDVITDSRRVYICRGKLSEIEVQDAFDQLSIGSSSGNLHQYYNTSNFQVQLALKYLGIYSSTPVDNRHHHYHLHLDTDQPRTRTPKCKSSSWVQQAEQASKF